jgi:hypothetical protein
VLVRLSRVAPGLLGDLIGMAYRFVVREAPRGSKKEEGAIK